MIKKYLYLMAFAGVVTLFTASQVCAAASAKVTATVIVSSNEGDDFDIDNDAYRDQLIELFSYTSYKQLDAQNFDLEQHKSVNLDLIDGYVLHITYQGTENDRVLIQADIRKDGKELVDTVLAIHPPSAAFLGGPPVSEGTLIIVLETGY